MKSHSEHHWDFHSMARDSFMSRNKRYPVTINEENKQKDLFDCGIN